MSKAVAQLWRAFQLAWLIALITMILLVLGACSRQPPTGAADSRAVSQPTAGVRSPVPAAVVPISATQPSVVIVPQADAPGVVVTMPDGSRIEAPAGSSVDVEDSGGSLTRRDSASSQGGTAAGTGEDIKGNAAIVPGEVGIEPLDGQALGGGGSRGSTGGINSAYELHGIPPSAGKYGGYGLGFILIIAGVVLLVLPFVYPAASAIPFRQLIAWTCVIAGASLIALVYIAASPMLMGIIVAAFVLGLIGFAIWSMLKGASVSDARDSANWAIVAAVNDIEGRGKLLAANADGSPMTWEQVAAEIKSRVDYHTDSSDDDKVKGVVSAIKSQL